LSVHAGPAITVAKELAKFGTKPVSVTVTSPKCRFQQEIYQGSLAEAGHTAVCAVAQPCAESLCSARSMFCLGTAPAYRNCLQSHAGASLVTGAQASQVDGYPGTSLRLNPGGWLIGLSADGQWVTTASQGPLGDTCCKH